MTDHGFDSEARLLRIASQSFSALLIRFSAAGVIQRPAFSKYYRYDRSERVPPSFYFRWSVRKNIHRPPSRMKQFPNIYLTLKSRFVRFHLDKNIDIAIRPLLSARATAEEDNTLRLHGF